MACVPGPRCSSVYPSAGEDATNAAAMVDAAPGLFSTITGCFHSSLIRSATIRAVTSEEPPGGKPTTIFTDRLGKLAASWPSAGNAVAQATAIEAMRAGVFTAATLAANGDAAKRSQRELSRRRFDRARRPSLGMRDLRGRR